MTTASGATRIAKVAEALQARSIDALIVSEPANVRYLTGYTGSNGLVLVFADSGRQDRFFTDFRYQTQAAAEVGAAAPACEIEIVGGELLAAAGKLLRQDPPSSVGFEADHLTVAVHRRLAGELSGACELVGCSGIVQALRAVKDSDEQRRIEAAAQLADRALREVLEAGLSGKTEREIAIELEARMRRLGAEAPSFATIVAGGAHGALPHAQPRDVKLRAGELVTIDWGALLDGYCSDCTRTFALGEPSDRAREIYELVLRAQRAGVAALAPGRSGREVDAVAREVIERAGYGERFGHGLGHGVGLEIHEGPRLSKSAPEGETLQAGSVVTVEPGVYLPGELGVRIEDLLLLAAEGARSLSLLSLELTVLD